ARCPALVEPSHVVVFSGGGAGEVGACLADVYVAQPALNRRDGYEATIHPPGAGFATQVVEVQVDAVEHGAAFGRKVARLRQGRRHTMRPQQRALTRAPDVLDARDEGCAEDKLVALQRLAGRIEPPHL